MYSSDAANDHFADDEGDEETESEEYNTDVLTEEGELHPGRAEDDYDK